MEKTSPNCAANYLIQVALHANSQEAGNELRIGSLGLELTVLLLFQVLQGRNSVPVPADEFETKKSDVETASAM